MCKVKIYAFNMLLILFQRQQSNFNLRNSDFVFVFVTKVQLNGTNKRNE